jgi:hypothetical protein
MFSHVLFSLSQLSLPVAIVNLIAARTAFRLGVHLGPSDADFPPRKKERFPIMFCPACRMLSRSVSHLLHRNRKCSIVSGARPHLHMSDSAAPILLRYPLILAIPVRSCESTSASCLLRLSYSAFVCLPGRARSIRMYVCMYVYFSSGGPLAPKSLLLEHRTC